MTLSPEKHRKTLSASVRDRTEAMRGGFWLALQPRAPDLSRGASSGKIGTEYGRKLLVQRDRRSLKNVASLAGAGVVPADVLESLVTGLMRR